MGCELTEDTGGGVVEGEELDTGGGVRVEQAPGDTGGGGGEGYTVGGPRVEQTPGCGGFGKGNFGELFRAIEEYETRAGINSI